VTLRPNCVDRSACVPLLYSKKPALPILPDSFCYGSIAPWKIAIGFRTAWCPLARKGRSEGWLFGGPERKENPTHAARNPLDEPYLGVSPGPFTIRDEANAIVAYAFRNGPIENLHAGKHSELLTDQSLSRITNEEMKTIMISACRKVEELLLLKQNDPHEYKRRIRDYNLDYCKGWER
jgi:hypothetical protein